MPRKLTKEYAAMLQQVWRKAGRGEAVRLGPLEKGAAHKLRFELYAAVTLVRSKELIADGALQQGVDTCQVSVAGDAEKGFFTIVKPGGHEGIMGALRVALANEKISAELEEQSSEDLLRKLQEETGQSRSTPYFTRGEG